MLNENNYLVDFDGPVHLEPHSASSPQSSSELSNREQDDEDHNKYFDFNSMDEQEWRETAGKEELHAHVATLLALSQPNPLPSVSTKDELNTPPKANSQITNVKITQKFIKEIQAATLENEKLDNNVIHHLCNPSKDPVDISGPDICLSLDLGVRANSGRYESLYFIIYNQIMLNTCQYLVMIMYSTIQSQYYNPHHQLRLVRHP
jgi:hypothetical protein